MKNVVVITEMNKEESEFVLELLEAKFSWTSFYLGFTKLENKSFYFIYIERDKYDMKVYAEAVLDTFRNLKNKNLIRAKEEKCGE